MIQLSPRGKVIYQFLSLTVFLVLLYGIGFSLSALSQLPVPPLAGLFSAVASQRFTAQIFKLLCLTGFISAGIMMAQESLSDKAIIRMLRGWVVVVALTAVVSPFEYDPLLDTGIALALLVLLAWSLRAVASSSFLRVWRLGMFLIAISLPAAHFATSGAAEAIAAFQVQAAFPLCALSTVFWLMPRYSSVGGESAGGSLRIVAVLLCLGGSLISLGRLGLTGIIGLSAAPLIVLCYIILGSHLARSLRNRNENNSLAPHWIALATLCWVAGGFLGGISVQNGVSRAMRGTDMSAAQDWLGGWVIVAVALAFINEAARSLRGDNRRVTGYLPLWLIAFGMSLSFIAQLCRGVAQFYLREFGSDASVSEAELLLPITVVWVICLLAIVVGVVVYTLGYFLRRPEIRVVER